MLSALALLLIQPFVAPRAFSAEKIAVVQMDAQATLQIEPQLAIQPAVNPEVQPEQQLAALTADIVVPVPAEPQADAIYAKLELVRLPVSQPADPEPFIIAQPLKQNTISVDDLRAENHRKERTWMELGLVEHSAATFDAYTTRRAISDMGGHELNPLFKPFAGNASMYVAIQVGPAIMDYVAKKMLYSRHDWVRKMWWVPQSASTVTSLFCGAHNLGIQSPAN